MARSIRTRLLRALPLFCAALYTTAFFLPSGAAAREQIRVVGSSTVYPFVTVIAEEFGNRSGFRTPIVESTGTGGGFKLFCSGLGEHTPDSVNASRSIKEGEIEECASNGVTDILPIALGFDGIVVANATHSPRFDMSKQTLFLALAKYVPQNGALIENPYTHWHQIDAQLPAFPIKVYGPPPTSGTRDSFVELVMEAECDEIPAFVAAYPDKKQRQRACRLMREDGGYIDAGENDNLIIQKLNGDPQSLGIFGFSFLEENADKVQGSAINGVVPSIEHIANGSYSIARPLFIYMKGQHMSHIRGLAAFTRMLLSDDALSDEGLLAMKGLVPLPADRLKTLRAEVLPRLQEQP